MIFNKFNKKGFSLFEIMIAIFIFSVIVATIFGSYNAVFFGVEKIEQSIELSQMANSCLSRVTKDLESIYIEIPPLYSFPEFETEPNIYRVKCENNNIGENEFSKLRFTSFAHLAFDKKIKNGICEIVYYVQAITENNDKTKYVLRRKDTLYPYPDEFEEDKKDPILCEGLKSFKFLFYDDEGNEHESWDSESQESGFSTPYSIKIKFEIQAFESPPQLFETTIVLPVFRKKYNEDEV